MEMGGSRVAGRPSHRPRRPVETRGLKLPLARNLRCLWLRRTSALYPGRAVDTQVVRYFWNRFLD